jgi:bifunctional non-homologous end joining protein LigD
MYRGASAMGLEGVMAKRSESTYQTGRSPDWLKMKVEHTEMFTAVGFTQPEGSRTGFGALHIAAYRDGALSYAGRVGTGFSDGDLVSLHQRLLDSASLRVQIDGLPDDPSSTWVDPDLVIEVRYKEVTEGGSLRHPVFVKAYEDLALSDVADLGPLHSEPTQATPQATSSFTPSNLDKVFWPEDGYTKGDLITYYERIASRLLPYLIDRPLVTVRYPDGINGKSFYQKNAPDFVPASIRTEWIGSSDDDRGNNYFVCDDAASLQYIINLGAIPLHLWASRVATIEVPDWCVLDLDPKTAPFASVITIARRIKQLCDDMGVASFPKTSGQSGLHILIPMGEGHTYTQQKLLGELIARVVEGEMPDIATTVRSPAARGDRVYIDFLQNGRGKLIAAPYTVRPVPGASVSTPLRWTEVTSSLDPSRFTIRSIPRRLQRMTDDPLAPLLTAPSDIARGLSALAAALA